jgi:hypothetical protein
MVTSKKSSQLNLSGSSMAKILDSGSLAEDKGSGFQLLVLEHVLAFKLKELKLN